MAELPKDMIFHYYSEDGITIKVDAVPLVRCGECRYWNGDGYYCDYDMQGHAYDYCSWGKRRTDDEV